MSAKDSRGKQTVATTVDLEDTHNRMQFKQLVELLVQYGISLTLARRIAAELQERKVAMRLGNWISTPQQLKMRLPQGSPLSPFLNNVYTKELADMSSNGLSWVLTLADDGLIYKTASDPRKSHRYPGAAGKCVTLVPRDRVQTQFKQGASPVVHHQQQSSRGRNASSLLQRRSYSTHEQTRMPQTHFVRLLTHTMRVESTKHRYRKGLSALKAMAAKGIEQYHLFLLYHNAILKINDHGLDRTTLS